MLGKSFMSLANCLNKLLPAALLRHRATVSIKFESDDNRIFNSNSQTYMKPVRRQAPRRGKQTTIARLQSASMDLGARIQNFKNDIAEASTLDFIERGCALTISLGLMCLLVSW